MSAFDGATLMITGGTGSFGKSEYCLSKKAGQEYGGTVYDGLTPRACEDGKY